MASLVYIVSEIKATNFENFQAILNLALATATVLAAGTVPRENVSVDLAVSALDALSTLHTQVRDCIVGVLDVVCETAIAYLFFSLSPSVVRTMPHWRMCVTTGAICGNIACHR